MRILELSLRNYRVFEQVDLELPARVIGIFGPNGSGKSTLTEAIQFACYGTGRTKKDQIRTHGVLTDCEVRLVFEHGGQQYEVRRRLKGRNHQPEAEVLVGGAALAVGSQEVDQEIRRLLGMDQQVFRSSVFAEQKQLDAFSDLTRSKRKEMVLRLLGIKPVDEARTSARKAARERRADAERLAGTLPDVADQEAALDGAREALVKARHRADETASALRAADDSEALARAAFEESDRARQEAEKLEARLEAAEEALAALRRRRDELTDRREGSRAALEALPGLEEEADRLADARELLEAARAWAGVASELREAEEGLDALPHVDPEAALEDLTAAEAALHEATDAAGRAEAAADRAAEDLARAEAELGRAGELDASKPCPTCGQSLGEAFRDVVAHREAEVTRLREAAASAREAAKEAASARRRAAARRGQAAKRGEEARRTAEERARLTRQAEALREKAARLAAPFDGASPEPEELRARAERADEVARDIARLEAEARHLDQLRKDLKAVEAELSAGTERLEALAAERAALSFDAGKHAALRSGAANARAALEQARRDEREASDAAKEAEKEVARLEEGIAAVRESAAKVGELREESRYTERVALLLDGFRDHLVGRIGPELSREAEALFRDLTNHEYEDLKIDEEDLSIHIADGAAYFPIERFSGSEADLANLALRVAISMHLSRVSGADLGMMVLDEVLASLDAERKDLMVRAMGRLANRFHQLFVITHAEQVKDQFEAVIEVRKTARRRSEALLA